MNIRQTIFDLVGGEEKLDTFVDEFIERVKQTPELASLYPDDMSRLKGAYKAYAMEMFGGPKTFSREHDWDTLEHVHKDIPITRERADAMVNCAVQTMEHFRLPHKVQEMARGKLEDQIYNMINC